MSNTTATNAGQALKELLETEASALKTTAQRSATAHIPTIFVGGRLTDPQPLTLRCWGQHTKPTQPAGHTKQQTPRPMPPGVVEARRQSARPPVLPSETTRASAGTTLTTMAAPTGRLKNGLTLGANPAR